MRLFLAPAQAQSWLRARASAMWAGTHHPTQPLRSSRKERLRMASIDDTPTVIIRRTEDGGHDAASSLHSHADLLGCEAVSRLVQASAREPRHNQRSLSESGLLRWLPSHIVVPSGQQSLCWPS